MRLIALTVLALLTGCTPETTTTPAERPTVERPAGEHLLGDAPQGWQRISESDNPGLRQVEFVPEDNDPADWQEKITFESLSGKPLPDPIEFLNGYSDDQERNCEGFSSFPTFSGEENGYPTSVRLLVCNRSSITGKANVAMMKAIQGNDYFYVITRAQRGAPLAEEAKALSDEEAGGWSLFLRSIKVCDPSRAEEHPCPDTAGVASP